ncbi:hypothetical protein BDQ12DRAFT_676840 [Crucibulum laeve]|uniref:Uncharacterized protein n=1 Tax=Crucibulum laeve TaxID=68775 RepID=A0A5C3MG14_9AGAR|nr:hypothetical protein BDQ12DRAFT_676840 [Crucibulum laeve]
MGAWSAGAYPLQTTVAIPSPLPVFPGGRPRGNIRREFAGKMLEDASLHVLTRRVLQR